MYDLESVGKKSKAGSDRKRKCGKKKKKKKRSEGRDQWLSG